MKRSGIPSFSSRLIALFFLRERTQKLDRSIRNLALRVACLTASVLVFISPIRLWADDPPPTPEDLERLAAIEAFERKQMEADYYARFRPASEEFGIPVEVLMSISFAETRHEHLTWPTPENGMPLDWLTNRFLFPSNIFLPSIVITNRWETNFFRYSSYYPFFNSPGILWQHRDGRVAMWGMNKTNFLGAMLLQNEKRSLLDDCRILGLRDFDYDGQLDLLLRSSRGQLAIGTIRENKLVQKKFLDHVVSREWKCLGILNGGYRSTWIVWDAGERIVVCLLNGETLLEFPVIGARFLSAVAIGDFNNDFSTDILWEKNGLVGVDFLDWDTAPFSGPLRRSRVHLNGGKPVTAGWKIATSSDFNDDGKTDILWKNADGRLAVWLMNGTERIGTILLRNGQRVSPDWNVVSAKQRRGVFAR